MCNFHPAINPALIGITWVNQQTTNFILIDDDKQIAQAKPVLILLDVMMPGIDGFETCRQLKADPETANIPVIFMTALMDREQKETGRKLGAVDYVAKPFQEEEILARVKVHQHNSELLRS